MLIKKPPCNSCNTALDITVVNPFQTTYLEQSAEVPGHALRKAFEKKMSRHGDKCKQKDD